MGGAAPRWLKLAALALAVSPAAACRADAPAEAATAEAPAQAFLALTGRVVDAADVLSPAEEAALTEELAALERDTRVQFVVVSTPDLRGYDVREYTTLLGNAWGIGDRQRDDGLMLVVAPNERKVRIGTGLGLEKTLTDAECADVVAAMVERYGSGDIAGGTLLGARTLDQSLRAKLERVS